MVSDKKVKSLTRKELKAIKSFLIALDVLGVDSQKLQNLSLNYDKIVDTINAHSDTLKELEESLNARSKNDYGI